MPITFVTEYYGVATNDPNAKFIIRFKVTNSQNEPVRMANVTVKLTYGYMILITHSLQTDCDGEGTVEFKAIPVIGNYDLLKIEVAGQSTTKPIVLYNPLKDPIVIVDNAVYLDDEYYLTQEQLNTEGMLIQVVTERIATDHDYAFLIIDSFIQYRIPLVESTAFNFYLPPEFVASANLPVGKHKVFYGLHSESGNNYVPDYTFVNITHSQVDPSLLPLIFQSTGGEYINVTANIIGVKFTIPGDQVELQPGSEWEIYYTLQSPDNSRVSIASGIASSPNAIVYTTPSGFFPTMNETPIFFGYKIITQPGSVLHESSWVQKILDTI